MEVVVVMVVEEEEDRGLLERFHLMSPNMITLIQMMALLNAISNMISMSSHTRYASQQVSGNGNGMMMVMVMVMI
jgi:tetrahydromethanopterin S-methyltransferase subunit A